MMADDRGMGLRQEITSLLSIVFSRIFISHWVSIPTRRKGKQIFKIYFRNMHAMSEQNQNFIYQQVIICLRADSSYMNLVLHLL